MHTKGKYDLLRIFSSHFPREKFTRFNFMEEKFAMNFGERPCSSTTNTDILLSMPACSHLTWVNRKIYVGLETEGSRLQI